MDEGATLLSQGRFNEAIAVFNLVKQANPQDAKAYFYSGMALTEAGRLTAAALELGEAVRLDPQHPEYLILQANVFARLMQRSHVPHVEDTLAIFQKAGAAERLDASWLWLLVDAYYRVERFDDTLRALDLMEKRFPDDPRLDLNRGQVYALQGKFDLALESLRKSVAKYPDNALAHFELGKLLYRRGELPASKKVLLEAVRLEKNNAERVKQSRPAHAELRNLLGQIYFGLGQPEKAGREFEEAVRLAPERSDFRENLQKLKSMK